MTKQIVMILSSYEASEIMRQRENAARFERRQKEQETCDHQWRYSGHGHNDDAYDCTKCGKTEWR